MNKKVILGLVCASMIANTHASDTNPHLKMFIAKGRTFAHYVTGDLLIAGLGATAYGLTQSGVTKEYTRHLLCAQVAIGTYLVWSTSGHIANGIRKINAATVQYTGFKLSTLLGGLLVYYCCDKIIRRDAGPNPYSNILEVFGPFLTETGKTLEKWGKGLVNTMGTMSVEKAYNLSKEAAETALKACDSSSKNWNNLTEGMAKEAQQYAEEAAWQAVQYAQEATESAKIVGTQAANQLAKKAQDLAERAMNNSVNFAIAITHKFHPAKAISAGVSATAENLTANATKELTDISGVVSSVAHAATQAFSKTPSIRPSQGVPSIKPQVSNSIDFDYMYPVYTEAYEFLKKQGLSFLDYMVEIFPNKTK